MTGWMLFPEAAGIFGIELIHQFDQILLEDRHHRCDKDHGIMRKTKIVANKKHPGVSRLGILKSRCLKPPKKDDNIVFDFF